MRLNQGAPAFALASALLFASACSSPPNHANSKPFDWYVAVSELPEAVLAVCASGNRLVAVGGTSGQGAIFEWVGDSWNAARLPEGPDLLWWCWIDDQGTALAVGENATILRGTRGQWQRDDVGQAIPGDATLYGVWGAHSQDVFVVGGAVRPDGTVGVVAQFNGSSWVPANVQLPPRVLFKVWGTSGNNVWAVGAAGTILRHDGVRWMDYNSPTTERLIAVWGTAADDVYAVGGDQQGLIFHFDGGNWSPFDTADGRLSGVWTAPGRPLFVGGDRGYLARYDLDRENRPSVTRKISAIALPNVDFHSITGQDGAILAAGADLAGGRAGAWRGAIATHGGSRAGDVLYPEPIDAGPITDANTGPDAAVIADAGPPDAPPPDAAPLPGPGETCGAAPNFCAGDLDCWGLLTSNAFICTELCTNASECVAKGYGPDPCCAVPGFQTLDTVCIPRMYAECSQ